MTSLEKRIAALEAALTTRPVIGFFMSDAEMDPEVFVDQLIASGELAACDRPRALVIRWRTRAEEDAAHARRG
jgi:hypothetical protein